MCATIPSFNVGAGESSLGLPAYNVAGTWEMSHLLNSYNFKQIFNLVLNPTGSLYDTHLIY